MTHNDLAEELCRTREAIHRLTIAIDNHAKMMEIMGGLPTAGKDRAEAIIVAIHPKQARAFVDAIAGIGRQIEKAIIQAAKTRR